MTDDLDVDNPTLADYTKAGSLAFIIAMIFYPHVVIGVVLVVAVIAYLALNPGVVAEAIETARVTVIEAAPLIAGVAVGLLAFMLLLTIIGYVLVHFPGWVKSVLAWFESPFSVPDEITKNR